MPRLLRPSSVTCLSLLSLFATATLQMGGCQGGLTGSSSPPAFTGQFSDGRTTTVSVSSTGDLANEGAGAAAISANGRAVAFSSTAGNLVVGDTNYSVGSTIISDIFVHERFSQTTTRISVASNGTEANGDNTLAGIADDGQRVVFISEADNLVAGDTNSAADAFLHDRTTNTTTRVSVDSTGSQADGSSSAADISGDGRYVVFTSSATNLVASDTNGVADIFVHDTQTGQTTRISVNSAGTEADDASSSLSVSTAGRYIAFASAATNLVSNDTNSTTDVFVRDTQLNTTVRVSVASSGSQLAGESYRPRISGDGQVIAFITDTGNDYRAFVHDRDADGNGILDEPCTGCRATTQFYQVPDSERITSLDISADGAFIALTHSSIGPTLDSNVLIINLSSGATARLRVDGPGTRAATPAELANPFGAREFSDHTHGATLSRDGDLVAFIGRLEGTYTNATATTQAFVEHRP